MAKEKKAKVKKVKVKKEREPISKKKLILLVIPIVLILGGAVGAVSFLVLSGKSPEYYWEEKDKVASVTKIVGDRTCKTKKEEKSVTYIYSKVKKSGADIEKYVAYLEDKRAFVDIEVPKMEKTDTAKEEVDKKEDKKEQKRTHYELATATKKKESYIKMVIDVKKESYTIKTETKKGSLEKQIKKAEEARQKIEREADKIRSFTEVEVEIRKLSPEQLGLSIPQEQLSFVAHPGIWQVEEKNYYKVTVYSRQASGVTNYEASYLSDAKTISKFYRYDEETQKVTPIK